MALGRSAFACPDQRLRSLALNFSTGISALINLL